MEGAGLRRSSQKPHLQITGFKPKDRNILMDKIQSLGGIVHLGESFQMSNTHVVCNKPCRSEKFLAACASGKWIVTPQYIHDSYQRHQWLMEDPYEWNLDKIQEGESESSSLFLAPAKWRERIKEGGLCPFVGWKAAVLVSDKKSRAVYKRLIEFGGGTVVDLSLPIKDPSHLACTVNHVFIEHSQSHQVQCLLDIGVLCLDPLYIGDYLTMDCQMDARQYLVRKQVTRRQQISPKKPPYVPVTDNTSEKQAVHRKTSDADKSDHPVKKTGKMDRHTKKTVNAGDQKDNASKKTFNVADKIASVNKTIVKTAYKTENASREPLGMSVAGVKAEMVTQNKAAHSGVTVGPKTPMNKNKFTLITSTTKVNKITSFFRKVAPPVSPNHTTQSKADCSLSRLPIQSSSAPSLSLTGKSTPSVSCPVGRSVPRMRRIRDIMDETVKNVDMESSSDSEVQEACSMTKGVSCSPNLVRKLKINLVRLAPEVIQKTTENSHLAATQPSTSSSASLDKTFRIANATANSSTVKRKASVPKLRRIRDLIYEKALKEETQRMEDDFVEGSDDGLSKKPLVRLVRLTQQDITRETLQRNSADSPSDTHTPVADTSSQTIPKKQTCTPLKARKIKSNPLKNISTHDETVTSTSVDLEKSYKVEVELNTRKRLSSVIGQDELDASPRKKQRENLLPWRPIAFHNHARLQQSNSVSKASEPMTENMSCIYRSGVDEKLYISSLHFISASISPSLHPSVSVLHSLMIKVLLESENVHANNKAYCMLQRIVSLHPPNSPHMHRTYLSCLRRDISSEPQPDHAWGFISSIISSLVYGSNGKAAMPDRSQQSHLLLLKFIISLLETDYQAYRQSRRPGSVVPPSHKKCLLLDVFWPALKTPHMNKSCQELVSLLVVVCSSKLKVQLVEHLQHLVAMVADSLRGLQCTDICVPGNPMSDQAHLFVKELAFHADTIKDSSTLQLVFITFKRHWISLAVSKLLLDIYDDVLLPVDFKEPGKLTLNTIMKRFLYLIPPGLSGGSKSESLQSTPMKRSTLRSHRSPAKAINKRNPRGETKLLVACMKNNKAKVAELLSTPGVDVNMKDAAGWTPLHEAANHGNIECIEMLLNYHPPKSAITCYFPTEASGRVELEARGDEGITPLHDAVLHNRLEAAQMLLHFGGGKLLKTKTDAGKTALELANSDEMRQILTAPFNMSQLSINSPSKNSLLTESTISTSSPMKGCYSCLKGDIDNSQCHEACVLYCILLYNLLKSYLAETMVMAGGDELGSLRSLPVYIESWEGHLLKLVGGKKDMLAKFEQYIRPIRLLAECCQL